MVLPWTSVDFHGSPVRHPWVSDGPPVGVPWVPVGAIHGIPMGTWGDSCPWEPVGNPWEPMEENSMEAIKAHRGPMEAHGRFIEAHARPMGDPWKSMGAHR